MVAESRHWVAYTDGSCLGNRRNNKHARAGVGVFFGDDAPPSLNVSEPLRFEGPHTNQRAEVAACIRAVQQLEALGQPFSLLIRTDSQYVVKSMQSWIKGWLRNGWRSYGGGAVQNRDLLEPLWELVSRYGVQLEHVAGHAGIYGNEMADWLACRGAGVEKAAPTAETCRAAPTPNKPTQFACFDADSVADPASPADQGRVFIF